MKRLARLSLVASLAVSSTAAYACGGADSVPGADDGGSVPDASTIPGADGATPGADAGGPPPIVTCHATPRGDGPRKMLVTRPRSKESGGGYGTNGRLLEVLDVAADGALSRKGVVLEMNGPTSGVPTFTPDGAIAIVPLGRGAGIASVAFDASGNATIVEAGLGDFAADHVTIDATGSRAFVLDENTEEHRGGLYEMRIGCDGKLAGVGEVVPSDRALQLELLPSPARRGLYFGAAAGSPGDLHLLELPEDGTAAKVQKSLATFGDAKSLPPSLSVTVDGAYAFVPDTGFEVGNRLAVVELATMTQKQSLVIDAPEAVLVSPRGNGFAVVQSDTFDAYVPVTFDPSRATPLVVGTKIATARKVELPTQPVTMKRGALEGTVFVVEVSGIRTLRFEPDGTLVDRGLFSMDVDKDLMNAPFNLAVQP